MAYDQRAIQQNIQGQLPVIPNNGNPGGANNMPQVATAGNTPPPPANPYQWVEPSQYMTNVREMLAQQAQRLAANTEHPTDQGKFNVTTDQNGFNLMPVDNGGMPMSGQVPVVPLRSQEQIQQNPNAPVLPQYLNP